MNRDEIRKLVGGYATGTLSDQERRALFEAALADQDLFEALADEQTLREVLADPRCRRRILEALRETPQPLSQRIRGWVRRPQVWTLAGSLAASVILALAVMRVGGPQAPRREVMVERTAAPLASAPPAPASAAARAQAEPRERPKLFEMKPAAPKQKAAVPLPPPPAVEPAAIPAPSGGVAGGVIGGVAAPAPAPGPPAAAGGYANPPRLAEAAPSVLSTNVAARPATARDLFFQARGPGAPAAAEKAAAPQTFLAAPEEAGASLGLRYTVLERGPDGAYSAADPNAVFGPEKSLRLRIETNQRAYLSVVASRGLLLRTLAEPSRAYTIDLKPEDRNLQAVLSRQPGGARPDASFHTAIAPLADRPVTLKSAGTGEKAVYVVSPGAAPGARVVAEIHLNRP